MPNDTLRYSGTFDEGPSEIGMTTLQGHLFQCYIILTSENDRDNLSIKEQNCIAFCVPFSKVHCRLTGTGFMAD